MLDASAKPRAPVRAITFDLDDTLWPVMPVIERAERAFLDWCRTHAPALADTLDLAALTARRKAFMMATPPEQRVDLTALRRRWMRALAVEHGCDAERLARDGFAAFWRARCSPEPFPDAADVLETLAARVPLGAVTNGNACVFRTPLGAHFDFATSAIEAGGDKASGAPFALAAERATASPSHLVHVGDDPVHDIVGARRAGVRAIWFNPAGRPWPCELGAPPPTIGRLGHLVERFSALVSAADRATSPSP